MEYKKAINKTLALVLWAKDESGKDDVAVFPGAFKQRDSSYFLERDDGKELEIRDEWLERIKEVTKEKKEILCNCEYILSLSVGSIESSKADFESYGLKWPSKE